MVFHASNCQSLYSIHPRDASHVSPKPWLHSFRNDRPSLTGGKNTMDQQTAVCVGHGGRILHSAVPTGLTNFLCGFVSRQGRDLRILIT